jgi:ABC-2 type transport system permease protein
MTTTVSRLERTDWRRPTPWRLLADQVVYALRELWRARLVLIFTFILPLVWLVLIGILAGNDAVDEVTGVRVMQFVTPTAIVMGVLFATLPPLATSLSLVRDAKILKRLEGTPLPAWAYLGGRIGGSVTLALTSVALMLSVGVLAYDVQIIGRTILASVVTLTVGVISLSALGLAVGALAPSAASGQAISIAAAVGLSFISGMFVIGAHLPDWVDVVAGVFPLRHLVTALQDQFNPFLGGAGWDPVGLAVIGIWAGGSLLVAVWALRREPRVPSVAAVVAGGSAGSLKPSQPGPPPRILALALDQMRWANRSAWRDPGWLFFAILMPVGLYALMTAMYGESFRPSDMPMAFFFACGMTAYGIAVTAFINMPETVARAREARILKRLRGTPLSAWQYLAGRTASVVWIAVLTAVLVFAVAILGFGAVISAGAIPLALLVLVLGAVTLLACGFALVAVLPSAKSVGAVGLGILLPLSFFSDVFLIGGAPEWMGTIGAVFPLRHFVHALASVLDPANGVAPWTNIAVMIAWLIGATGAAIRWFRWEAPA